MNEIIIAFLTGVLGPIGIIIIKHYLEKRKKKDTVVEAVVNANVVYDELEKISEEFGADRVWVAQFHNGGHYYPTGKSIQKFSIFFENSKKSQDSIQRTFQNIPVNLFSKSLGAILDKSYIAIPDYREETIATYGLKHIAEENGTKSSYLFAINNVEDRCIAILAVEYTQRRKTLSDENIVELRLEASKLGGVLNSQLKKQ